MKIVDKNNNNNDVDGTEDNDNNNDSVLLGAFAFRRLFNRSSLALFTLPRHSTSFRAPKVVRIYLRLCGKFPWSKIDGSGRTSVVDHAYWPKIDATLSSIF